MKTFAKLSLVTFLTVTAIACALTGQWLFAGCSVMNLATCSYWMLDSDEEEVDAETV